MGRSGTSALSGVITMLGAYPGEKLLEARPENAKGFFENSEILKLNDYLLSKMNTSWDDPNDASAIDVHLYLELVKYVLHNIFMQSSIIVIKDPRTCLLYPIYSKALLELGYEIYRLRTKRNVEEVIASLISRDGFSSDKCLRICEKYDKKIDEIGMECLNVEFDKLLTDTDSSIESIRSYLPFLNYEPASIEKIKSFLDVNLKHH